MTLQSIYAQLNCTDIQRSGDWFQVLFDRSPDASPMDGLIEWHHGDDAGFQLFEKREDAGHGTLTLIVSDLEAERSRLVEGGLNPSEVGSGDAVLIVSLSDPDGNMIVLAEPQN